MTNKMPKPADIAACLYRMNTYAATDTSRAGRHADSAAYEQLATKWRNVTNGFTQDGNDGGTNT